MGNKGFMSNKDFKLILLISGNYESLDELFKVLNVDKKYFKVVRIIGWKQNKNYFLYSNVYNLNLK